MSSHADGGRQLKAGAILSYTAIFINIISALVYSPWMLSKIGSGDYGLYTLAVSLINMFMLDFGISAAVTRFTSKYLAEGKQEYVNYFLSIVIKLFAAISFLACIGLVTVYFFIDKIYASLTVAELERFKVVYIISAAYSVISLPFATTINGILTSYEKFIQMKICDIGNKVGTVLLIVIALLNGYGLYALVAINATLNLIFFLVKWILIKSTTPVKIPIFHWNNTMLKEIFGFSIWTLINSVCSRLIMNICPNILGITSGTLAITVFSFASTIEGYAYMFSSAVDGMFMPKIARIVYGVYHSENILPLMVRVGRFQFHLVGLITIGFICAGKEFVSLWIGDDYMSVYYCAVLLLLPAPFYLSQQIGKNTMVMLNKVKYLTLVNVIKALFNVILVALFSIKLGGLGACISICVVYCFRNLANMYLYKKHIGINIKIFYKECYGRMSISMAVTLIIGVLINRFFSCSNWFFWGLKVIGIILIYEIFMWFLSFNKGEKNLIKSTVSKALRLKGV